MSAGAHLSLKGLTKIYDGRVRAVDGVELDVQDGEFVTLVGPSGCGKSTTLRMIAGFIDPTAGSIEMNGQDITALPPNKRDIGMVFQSIALFPHMTVAENISYGMKVANESFSRSEMDERVEEMLELIEMPETADRYPEQLSGGQQQRIGLARSLALRPEILLLDEPLSALDEKLREQMQTELTKIQQELGVTTVFVTHNQEEAMTMSDRIVIMDDGHFAQIGSPEEVYNNPQSTFVADFMGKSNLFPGTVSERGSRQSTVRTDAGEFVVEDTSFATETSVQLLVRPEDFRMSTTSAPDSKNMISGTIEITHLLGSVARYHVSSEQAGQLIVEDQSGGQSVTEGQQVQLSVDPADCFVIPDPEPAIETNVSEPAKGVYSSE
ncbi:ABC transporter ATP-binding protein [Natranaeroarchaeum aerophilus]|uniref:Molybdate/tungstate import ATP-binding protein WtpC n=1 Tax=Natranaeroarchaeum aerophilus TaxID=2917711 RepID=A0AAE3FRV0_9EURY|nr:ABC transporter ATP-binding protein [Natranaeroarchaeum aerophilus]MCL9813409.1 ABC transporter ATP-binding protein [Natranaeroarchaeum aerophilus]